MAKFELPIYDITTGEVVYTHKRNFMPVGLYIRFQEFAEKTTSEKFKSDKDFFKALQPLFLETFPDLTEDEYLNQTDIAQVLIMFRDILDKSTEISDGGNSKNG